MLVSLFLFQSAAFATQVGKEVECEDQELHDTCLTECRLIYIDCLSDCDTSFCNSECLLDFQDCDSFCPCGYNCPSGCDDCDHPLCLPFCEDAEINNDEYQFCLSEEINQMEVCLKTSSPFLKNYDSCYESFRENVLSCPCVEDQAQKDPSDTSILSILYDVSQSYVMTGDGSTKVSAKIEEQKQGQVMFSKHAIIKEKLYLFGTGTKIAILFECSIVEIAEKLIYNRDERAEALSITEGTQALICFSENSHECEIFDGRTSRRTLNSTFTHDLGGLGYYKGQPTSVGCQSTNNKKAETLSASGWTTLPDFPENYASHNLIGLRNGGMILVGGYNGVGYFSRIWQLKDDRWTKLGDLQNAHGLGSAIFTSNAIYVFPGGPKTENEHAVQRIDLTAEEEFIRSQIIGFHSGWYKYPILFETSTRYCL